MAHVIPGMPVYNLSEFLDSDWLPADPTRPNGSSGEAPFMAPLTIAAGARNDTLYRLARALHAKQLSGAAIRAALHAENAAKCAPPLPSDEVDEIATNAATQADRPDFVNVEAEDIVIDTPAPHARRGLDPAFLADSVVVTREGQTLERQGIPYAIDGIIPDFGMLGFLIAFAKVGKTTFGLALAAAVAMGLSFLDRAVRRKRVLVIAAEDPPEYVAYGARHLTVDPDWLTFYRAPLILNHAGLTALSETIQDRQYGLVLIASWQAVIRGLTRDENDNAGGAALVEHIKTTFARQTGIPWLIDAHSGKGEDGSDDADPTKALRGASSAAGAADYLLSLRYADTPFSTKRRLSGKGRFVSFSPLTLDFDPTTSTYTCLGSTKDALRESTWRLVCETGALDDTPRSLGEIAATCALTADGQRLDGTARRRLVNALAGRPNVGHMDGVRRGQKTTLYYRLQVAP